MSKSMLIASSAAGKEDNIYPYLYAEAGSTGDGTMEIKEFAGREVWIRYKTPTVDYSIILENTTCANTVCFLKDTL